MKRVLTRLLIGSGLLPLLTQSANACATCMGKAENNLGPAVSNSVLFLLGVVLAMCTAFILFGFYLGRRSSETLEGIEGK